MHFSSLENWPTIFLFWDYEVGQETNNPNSWHWFPKWTSTFGVQLRSKYRPHLFRTSVWLSILGSWICGVYNLTSALKTDPRSGQISGVNYEWGPLAYKLYILVTPWIFIKSIFPLKNIFNRNSMSICNELLICQVAITLIMIPNSCLN